MPSAPHVTRHPPATRVTFISLRFEDIVCQYFKRLAQAGKLEDVEDFGTFWYEAPATKTNGQFDCVLKKQDGYAFYEMKFYEHPMTLSECEKEEAYLKQMESGALLNPRVDSTFIAAKERGLWRHRKHCQQSARTGICEYGR